MKKTIILIALLALCVGAYFLYKKKQAQGEKTELVNKIRMAFAAQGVPAEYQLTTAELEAKTVEELRTLLTEI